MSSRHAQNHLKGRRLIAAKAVEALCPLKKRNPVNWEAVAIVVEEYDNNPSEDFARKLLKELTDPTKIIERLNKARIVYIARNETKVALDLLLKKMDQGFNAIEDRALKAEADAKKQRPWILAGKILSGVFAVFLGFCTFLGVPTKYTKPYLDKYVDPLLEKIGFYRIDPSEKIERPAVPDQGVNATSPAENARLDGAGAEVPPEGRKQQRPAHPQPKPKKQSMFNAPNNGELACFRSPQARKIPCRHYHI